MNQYIMINIIQSLRLPNQLRLLPLPLVVIHDNIMEKPYY